MTPDTIKIGLIGAGANTRTKHIPGLLAQPGVEIVGVANRSRESGQRVAGEFNIPRVYDTWVDLIAEPEIDAVCIGTWPYMHRILVMAALDNDKHVLTEARLAMNAQEAMEMLDASRRKPHLITQVVPAPFTLKLDRTISDLIAEGYLGDLLSVDLATQGAFIDREASLMWRHDRDLSGYNIMLMGAWYECLMRTIGPATSVTAVTRVNVKSRVDDSGNRRVISIPDHVEVLCEMASGAVLHMRFSEVTGLSPSNNVWMFGTEGTLHFEAEHSGESSGLFGGRKGDTELSEIELPLEKQGGWRVEEEFINAIRGIEKVTHNTFETGVKYMEFAEAVTRSAQTGRRVYLPL